MPRMTRRKPAARSFLEKPTSCRRPRSPLRTSARRTQAAQLDHLPTNFEPMRRLAMRQLIGEIVAGNFDGSAATVAHQKLAAMRHADFAASF
jgi:hypothetical protein